MSNSLLSSRTTPLPRCPEVIWNLANGGQVAFGSMRTRKIWLTRDGYPRRVPSLPCLALPSRRHLPSHSAWTVHDRRAVFEGGTGESKRAECEIKNSAGGERDWKMKNSRLEISRHVCDRHCHGPAQVCTGSIR